MSELDRQKLKIQALREVCEVQRVRALPLTSRIYSLVERTTLQLRIAVLGIRLADRIRARRRRHGPR